MRSWPARSVHFGRVDLRISECKRHAWRGGRPHQRDFIGRETVGFVYQVVEAAFELQGFGGLGAGGFDRSGVFVSQAFQGGGRERVFIAANPLHFGDEGVGIQFGRCLQLQARLFDAVFHTKPVQDGSAHRVMHFGYLN